MFAHCSLKITTNTLHIPPSWTKPFLAHIWFAALFSSRQSYGCSSESQMQLANHNLHRHDKSSGFGKISRDVCVCNHNKLSSDCRLLNAYCSLDIYACQLFAKHFIYLRSSQWCLLLLSHAAVPTWVWILICVINQTVYIFTVDNDEAWVKTVLNIIVLLIH